jgi:DNA-binding NarL/FixJ family response regulator
MIEPRPHRDALTADEAATKLRDEVRAGRLDSASVDAVLEAAGHRTRRRGANIAGLTNREIEVLELAARGFPNREIARRLSVTPKTVGNHIEHIYTKIGETSRAGAALYAMRNGLVDGTSAACG